MLAEERRHLDALQADGAPESAITAQRERIEELVVGRERYRQQKATAEAFLRRFGLTPRPTD